MRNQRISLICMALLAVAVLMAEDSSDRFYQAIRNDNLGTLRGLLKTSAADARDQRETTPLMYAAASIPIVDSPTPTIQPKRSPR